MKNHCVSLEIAKQLKGAGWKKEVYFHWINSTYDDGYEGEGRWYCDGKWQILANTPLISNGYTTEFLKDYPGNNYSSELTTEKISKIIVLPAPLATEILEEFPLAKIEKISKLGFSVWCPDSVDWDNPQTIDNRSHDFSLPDALAKMWLSLKKENLI